MLFKVLKYYGVVRQGVITGVAAGIHKIAVTKFILIALIQAEIDSTEIAIELTDMKKLVFIRQFFART